MTEGYKYETFNTARVYLAEGWYTMENLQDLLNANNQMNKHLENSMKLPNELFSKKRKKND